MPFNIFSLIFSRIFVNVRGALYLSQDRKLPLPTLSLFTTMLRYRWMQPFVHEPVARFSKVPVT